MAYWKVMSANTVFLLIVAGPPIQAWSLIEAGLIDQATGIDVYDQSLKLYKPDHIPVF